MGAKAPTKLKLRRPTYKCDICNRKLLSAQALKTHQYCIHKIQDTSSRTTKPKAKKTEKPVIKSKVNPKDNKHDNQEEIKELPSAEVSDVRKIEFECPVCNIMFPAYFSAYRHIQKLHSVNSKGQKVELTSVDLIKPSRVEMCIKCNKRVRSDDIHNCFESPLNSFGMEYVCAGCQQKFASMQLYDLHVSWQHSDGVESMFFPNMNEFLTWKMDMQNKTNMNYLVLGKCNSKQTYRCTNLPPSEATSNSNRVSHMCPAGMVVQEFTKGIQVHFYKKHHGHNCPEYTCPDKFKKFLITSLMQEKSGEDYEIKYDDKDLYCQFKVLLESIIVEAAKVKIDDLKLMLEKALEMTSILNNYDEDDDSFSNVSKQNLCEDQITKALDSFKRKINTSENSETKKLKFTPKIVNAFSMADMEEVEKKETVKADETVKKDVKKDDLPTASPVASRILRNSHMQSFNDTYKDFVDKNFKQGVDKVKGLGRSPRSNNQSNGKGLRLRPISKLIESSDIEKELEKDLIEVPPPNNNININTEDSDILKIPPNISVKRIIPGVKEEPAKPEDIKEREPVNELNVENSPEVNSKTKGPVVKKDFAPKVSKPKKQVMKTKIGQFKPSLSPKSSLSPRPSMSPKKPDLNLSFGKIKPDIEYEVKEQDNDCNILILKI